ncbi:MAG: hypothetical protein QOC78_1989 [Solirubrobacteraceae bacterium]|jgi:putative effector of murein hydrolase|nr:hypothetical protein [Solirubrobacteraceae bacterium]
MTPAPPSERLLARRRRTLRIRQVVGGMAVAIFLALFATIYVQLAAGRDPALTASAAPKTTAVPVTTTQSTPKKSSTSQATSQSPSAVTTRQS